MWEIKPLLLPRGKNKFLTNFLPFCHHLLMSLINCLPWTCYIFNFLDYGCASKKYQFKCERSGECLYITKLCDGQGDCYDDNSADRNCCKFLLIFKIYVCPAAKCYT